MQSKKEKRKEINKEKNKLVGNCVFFLSSTDPVFSHGDFSTNLVFLSDTDPTIAVYFAKWTCRLTSLKSRNFICLPEKSLGRAALPSKIPERPRLRVDIFCTVNVKDRH